MRQLSLSLSSLLPVEAPSKLLTLFELECFWSCFERERLTLAAVPYNRGSYRGGEITMASHSIKFNYD